VTEKTIDCAYTVSNVLGPGFLEEVYENALTHELRKAGLIVQQQHHIQVLYDGCVVGEYTADMLVEGCILVELKAVKALDENSRMLELLESYRAAAVLAADLGKARMRIKRLAM
jgi:GxxExxY protein